MADYGRLKADQALHKVKSFINQNIRPKSGGHNQQHNNSRNQMHSSSGNGAKPQTNSSKVQRNNRVQSTTSEASQKNINHVSTISSVISQKGRDNDQQNITMPKNANIDNRKNNAVKQRPKPRMKLAIFILVGGTLLGLSQRELIEVVRDWIIVVEEDNFFTNIWADVPMGVNLCFHIFDLKNGRAFYKGAKPHLERIGPFCYKAFRRREITEWKEKTVTFYESFRLEFNPEASEPVDRDMTTINLPIYASILFTKELLERFYIKFAGPIVYNILNVALRSTGEKPIERIPIDEFLNGRKINIIVLFDKILDPLRRMGVPIPEYGYGGYKIVNQSYGIASLVNHATFGPIEAYRRSEDGKHAGDIVGLHNGRVWPGLKAPCNRLESSDGVFFPRPVTRQELTVFFYISCRLIKFVKQKEHYMYGAYLSRYVMDPEMFTMKNGDNHCFCKKGRSLASCEGLSDMSNCFLGLPIELSMPNFLYYDNLKDQVDGMKPDPEKHEAYLDIDPYLGSPVNIRLFVQGNLHLSKIPSVPVLANVREVPYPILMIQVNDGIGFRPYLIPAVTIISNYLRYSALIWFLGSALVSGALIYRRRK